MGITILIIVLLLIAFGICYLFIRHHYVKLLDVATKHAQKSEQLKSVFIEYQPYPPLAIERHF
jgi:hypothetical protein